MSSFTFKKNNPSSGVDKKLGTRIQKALAQAGAGSRREIEKAILNQRIFVNNQLAEIGQLVSELDKIIFDGKLIKINAETLLPRILIYHKPEGEIVSVSDPKGRVTVFDNLPKIKKAKWISIGRLDYNTSGLLIFTSYGELANRLMHPRYEIEREYSVRILGELSDEQLIKLTQGIKLEDGLAKFETISFQGGEGANHWYRVVLKEGRNREVRRLFESFGVTVSRLIRTRFGDIRLPSHIKRGMFIELSQKEVYGILNQFNIDSKQFIRPQIKVQKNIRSGSQKRKGATKR